MHTGTWNRLLVIFLFYLLLLFEHQGQYVDSWL
jgi:hypothetical protein